MNEPLTHRGYTFYQSRYSADRRPADRPATGQFQSVFQVGTDPGRPIKYAGCLLLVDWASSCSSTCGPASSPTAASASASGPPQGSEDSRGQWPQLPRSGVVEVTALTPILDPSTNGTL